MLTEILVVLILFGLAWYFLPNWSSTIIPDVSDGTVQVQKAQASATQFSYTCWLRIDHFGDYGKPKVIFVKGSPNLEHACPAVLLDGNTNTLLIKLDTFGNQETIPVTSVPAKKWLHFALTVQEHEMIVYINGIEYVRQTLVNLPKTNNGNVIASPDKGFSGRIAQLEMFPRVLEADDIASRAKSPPTVSESNQVFPPYLSMNWFKP
jgi:hypothetical protein